MTRIEYQGLCSNSSPSSERIMSSRETDQRVILLGFGDDHTRHRKQAKFCSNRVSTCKYNLISFFPRFLFEQFRKYNNIFFLVIALLQQIPDVSPTGRYTTAFPFVVIMAVSALKEMYEDIKRRAADHKVNQFPIKVLDSTGTWIEKKWRDIRVGDLVLVENNHMFPADLLLISSSEQQGMAYIETSNLDGETNLKIKQASDTTADLSTVDRLRSIRAEIVCELPSRHINEFNGHITIDGKKAPLGIDQLLLRGSRLKNTPWIYGAVVYSGHDTKLLKNSKTAPLKSGKMDRVTNTRILFLFAILVALALVSALGSELWQNANIENSWYLSFTQSSKSSFLWGVLTFFILYNNLIPISLQVTLEMVRFFQAYYINNDKEMYDVNSDSCAVARTSNLNEELGQVKYLMSDKTGTLTRNVMKFKQVSIGSKNYGNEEDDEFNDPALLDDYYHKTQGPEQAQSILDLLTAMAVCHTTVPDKEAPGQFNYQGASPDESALVRGAACQKVIFHTRNPKSIVCDILGKDETFEILGTCEFTSNRKRMSVIARRENGEICLFIKGADNVIFDRLRPGEKKSMDICLNHLENYATCGYRTLVFAKKTLDQRQLNEWLPKYEAAAASIKDRVKKLEEVAEELETNLELIGATAIEDKLQEFVPETIQALLLANIKFWMLTGDKCQTAINIAHSCSLLKQHMELFVVEKNTYEDTYTELVHFSDRAQELQETDKEFALVIDGKSLRHALIGEARQHFSALALICQAVVCCRMSPMQKAEIVEMVRKETGEVVLAIGDGANDVAMIQAASVGVGISGEEGLQAASASDYAIPRFHYLRRLLFIHGVWNNDRSTKVVFYSFYKNICLYIVELWFAFFSAWSGQTIFERWTIGMFNVLFTALPPVMIGVFDRCVPQEQMTRFPSLYNSFSSRKHENLEFALWIGGAIFHSLILFFMTYAALEHQVVWSNGRVGGWLMMGNSAYTFVVATVCIKALLECVSWTWPVVASSVFSFVFWLIFVVVYSLVFMVWSRFGENMAGMAWIMYSSIPFWLMLILIPTATLMFDVVLKSLFTILKPSTQQLAILYSKKRGSGGWFDRLFNRWFRGSRQISESTTNFAACWSPPNATVATTIASSSTQNGGGPPTRFPNPVHDPQHSLLGDSSREHDYGSTELKRRGNGANGSNRPMQLHGQPFSSDFSYSNEAFLNSSTGSQPEYVTQITVNEHEVTV